MLQQMTSSEPQKNNLKITCTHICLDTEMEMENIRCNK